MHASEITAVILPDSDGSRLFDQARATDLLDRLHSADVRNVVFCIDKKTERIKEALGDFHSNLSLLYSYSELPFSPAAALASARELITSNLTLVLSVDVHHDFHLGTFVAWHRARCAAASLLLVPKDASSDLAEIKIGPRDEVIRIDDRLASDKLGREWVSADIYLICCDLLKQLPLSTEHTLLRQLIGRGIYGFRNCHLSDHPALERTGSGKRYVILDRDGVINVDRDYLSDPNDLELLPGVPEALRLFRTLELGVVVVTNQSGVGRGYFDESQVGRVHSRLHNMLQAESVDIDAIYYCPHRREDECNCRKPATGLVDRAAADLGFRPDQAFVVGDKRSDVELGHAIGAITFLSTEGHGREFATDPDTNAHFVVDSLLEAAKIIESLVQVRGTR